MMENASLFVITVYSENQVGLLSSISNIFTRRNINIESLTVFPSEFPGIHKFTIRVFTTGRSAHQVVKFIEKKVEVVRAFCFECADAAASEHDMVSQFLNKKNNKR